MIDNFSQNLDIYIVPSYQDRRRGLVPVHCFNQSQSSFNTYINHYLFISHLNKYCWYIIDIFILQISHPLFLSTRCWTIEGRNKKESRCCMWIMTHALLSISVFWETSWGSNKFKKKKNWKARDFLVFSNLSAGSSGSLKPIKILYFIDRPSFTRPVLVGEFASSCCINSSGA